MLSLAKVTPEMGEHYFSKEDYYSQESGPALPEFYGKGASSLGIKGDFNQVTFQSLIQGKGPSGEQLRIIKRKQFASGGRFSYSSMRDSFIKDLNLGDSFTVEDFNEIAELTFKFSNAEIKFQQNKETINAALELNHYSKALTKTHRTKLVKRLLSELCERGALNGEPIKTLPENYLAYKDSHGSFLIDKLIERHLYLDSKNKDLSGLRIYLNEIKHYYPEIAQEFIGFESSKAKQDLLFALIKKSPVVGLWNDDNILESPDSLAKRRGNYVSKHLKLLEDREGRGPTLNELNAFVSEAELNIDPKVLPFADFCRKFSTPMKLVEKEKKEVNPDFSLKYHLSLPQKEEFLNGIKGKLGSKFDKKAERKTKEFLNNISKTSDRSGLDLTFSAPKSVSVATLVGGDQRLLDAHKEAVKFTLDYIESNYIGTRAGSKSERVFENTGNLVSGLFHHGTSRLQDPQLHTHCVIMNTTQGGNGKWKAIHNDQIYKNSVLFGTLYQKKLADLVMGLGYEIEAKDNGTFQISGYSDDQLRGFSKRSQQISETLKLEGLGDNARDKRQAVLINRKSKDVLEAKEQKEKWIKEAEGMNLKHPHSSHKNIPKSINWKFAKRHISENKSTFSMEELLLATFQANIARGTTEEILKGYEKSAEVRFLDKNNQAVKVTNSNTILKERLLVSLAINGRGKLAPINSLLDTDVFAKARKYTKGQSEAFKLSLSGRDFVSAWSGVAGSGKSYALNDLKEVATAQGFSFIGLGADGRAAKELGKSIGAKCRTLDSWLSGRQATTKKPRVIVIDEAGKIPLDKMVKLFEKAVSDGNTRIILVGDERQKGAVAAGSPFSILLKSGVAKAELLEHRRQDDLELKNAVTEASKPELIEKSVESLRNHSFERKTKKARINTLVREYMKLPRDKKEKTLILADMNKDRREITDRLRVALQENGEIGKEEIKVPILKQKNLSEAQKNFSMNYNSGDIVIPHSNIEDTALKANYQYTVTKSNSKTGEVTVQNGSFETSFFPKRVSGLTIYTGEEIAISEGDELQYTRNHNGKTNKESIVVSKIGSDRFYSRGSKEPILLSNKGHFLDYGLVKTTDSSQGMTSENVLYLAEASVSKESWYVAISRAKAEAKIVTDDIEKLKRRVLASSRKENILDIAPDLINENLLSREVPSEVNL